MDTSKAPMNQGLARWSQNMTSTPAAVASATHNKADPAAARVPGSSKGSTCKPQWFCAHCMAKGTDSTTITRRTLCAAATKSVRAPWRSANMVISEAPPMALAK